MRRSLAVVFLVGVHAGGLLFAAPARAEDWQVTRSPFDPRLVEKLKQQLHLHPDDGAALRRLVSLYKGYRSLNDLQKEISERAERSGEVNDLLAAGHVARERGQLDQAAESYRKARTAARSPLDRAAIALLLSDLAQRRTPPDTKEAQEQLQAALAVLPPGDARRRPALKKSAELAFLAGDADTAVKVCTELLKGTRDRREEQDVRQRLAEVLARAGRPQAALAEWRRLEALPGDAKARAEVEVRIGELLEAEKDEPAAIAAYKKGLGLLPRGHALRSDFYEHLLAVHRHRDDLQALVQSLEADWPAAGRGFLEWQLLGRVYDERGELDRATAAYRAALGKSPHSIDVRRRLIAVLERNGAMEEAIREYERLSADAPGESRYYLELAERLEQSEKRARALEVLRRAATRFAGDPSLHGALSDIYQRWGENELALKEAELLVRLDPRDEGHIVNLGEIYWARGRKDKAEEAWRRLLSVNPDRALGQARLADVFAEHNMMGQALELYQKALKAEPQNVQIQRGMALALERMNRPREALPLWEQLYFSLAGAGTDHKTRGTPGPDRRPLLLEARQHLSQLVAKEARLRSSLYAWQQRFAQQREHARQLPAGTAPGPELLALGMLYADTTLRLLRTAEAESVLRSLSEALPDGPDKGDVLLALAPIYRQQGKLQEAIAALKQAVALLPDRSRDLYAQLAELSLQTYHDDEAVGFAEKAVSDAQGELRLGELFERKDDVPHAIAAYRRAIALDDRLFRAHLSLARLHLRGGQLGEAAALYREVARRAPQEEMVLEAGRKAMDLHEYLGTLPELLRELSPLVYAYPQKGVYRKLMLLLYERYAGPLLAPARAGSDKARGELLRLGHGGLKPLTEALLYGDGGEQRTAVALLGDLGNPAAASALLRMAAGAEAEEPKKDAAPKGGAGTGALLGAVRPAGRTEIDLRVDALLAAARLADGRSGAALCRLSQSKEKQLRVGALYGLFALARLGRPAGTGGTGKAEAQAAEKALADPSPEVRGLGCLLLGELAARGTPLAPRLRAQMLGHVEGGLERGRRNDGAGPLLPAACAHGLGEAREPQAVPLLTEALREGNEDLALQAAWALGRIGHGGDRRVLLPLGRAVFLKQEAVRRAAAQALQELAQPAAPASRERVSDGTEVWGLPYPERGVDGLDLRRLLEQLSAAAEVRLAQLWPREESETFLPALEEALTSGNRELALRTFQDLLGDRELPAPIRRGLLPVLRRVLKESSDAAVREQALAAVVRLDGSAELQEDTQKLLVQAALSDPAPDLRLTAAVALLSRDAAPEEARRVLERHLRSPDRRQRLLAVQALRGSSSPMARTLLRQAAQDADGYVRESASR